MRVVNPLREWFVNVDSWSLFTLFLLLITGCVMIFSIAPDVAERLKIPAYYLAVKHMVFAIIALLVMMFCAFLNAYLIKRLAMYLLLLSFVMLVAVFFSGEIYNGSNRWLRIGGFTIQPSEFIKPAFAIVTAWLLSLQNRGEPIPGIILVWCIYVPLMILLLLQPDLGQSIFITLVLFVQWFVAGMPIMLLLLWISILLSGLVVTYVIFPHVTDRIQSFLSGADQYSQVNLSLKAFYEGGFLGEGLGGGALKSYLFDAQSDFVFAVLGEELGIFACILVLAAYGFVVLRGILRAFHCDDSFVVLAMTGLLMQFASQVWVNIGSVIGVIPPKGTTLPFISSGGTAMIAMGFAMGVVLSLGRQPLQQDIQEKFMHVQKPDHEGELGYSG